MDIDEPRGFPLPLLSAARNLNSFSLLDPNFPNGLLHNSSNFPSHALLVSHPRENNHRDQSTYSGPSTISEHINRSTDVHGSEIQRTIMIDDVIDEYNPMARQKIGSFGDSSHGEHPKPSAPLFDNSSDFENDIEAEMIQAAIDASKWEVEKDYHESKMGPYNDLAHGRQSPIDDTDLAHAISLSLKTAEQVKALHGLGVKVGETSRSDYKEVLGRSTTLNGRLEAESSFIPNEAEDVDYKPLVRQKSNLIFSSSIESDQEIMISPPSSSKKNDLVNRSPNKENFLPADEWGGISSEEHDEAVMLEAAIFGEISERNGFSIPFVPHQYIRPNLDPTVGSYQQPRLLSPSLETQRLIREQQDDEYLASLHADQEKELKELAAREAAFDEERLKEDDYRKKIEEEAEAERQLASKEASLPMEPLSNDENAITLLVRMPDGTRRGRRFSKFDKLQSLFDFIDIGRGVKFGTYRLVRPYPRQAFTLGESEVLLKELGLTSKHEALFLELI